MTNAAGMRLDSTFQRVKKSMRFTFQPNVPSYCQFLNGLFRIPSAMKHFLRSFIYIISHLRSFILRRIRGSFLISLS
jgi:hypothetical protein